MSISTKITPKVPEHSVIAHYKMMANLPLETVKNLAEALIEARCHEALAIWGDPQTRLGLKRYIANTALRLAAAEAQNGDAFVLKLNALAGTQFADADHHMVETIQLLLRAESRRLGVHVPEPEETAQEVAPKS